MATNKKPRKPYSVTIKKRRQVIATPLVHAMWFDPFVSFWEDLYKFGLCDYDQFNEPLFHQKAEGKYVPVADLIKAVTEFFWIAYRRAGLPLDLGCFERVQKGLYANQMLNFDDIEQGMHLMDDFRSMLNGITAKAAKDILITMSIKREFEKKYARV